MVCTVLLQWLALVQNFDVTNFMLLAVITLMVRVVDVVSQQEGHVIT